jgi:PAS domain S-box-containing protein
MRDHQQHLSEGFETAQEELTAANEELQSTLEEFQSSNEELETAKEELQASNEELTTLNGELQARAEELAMSEERFRLLIDSVKDYAIFMVDPEGKVKTWNEGARRFYGFEASEIIGHNFSRFYPPTDMNSKKPQNDLEVARTQGKYEEEGVRIRKGGQKFFASAIITAIRDETGSLRGYAKVTRDISERKLAEQALAESEERYRLMVEVVRDYAIFRLDSTGTIITWNEGAKNLKYYEAKEVIGKHFSIFYGKEDLEKGKPAWELQQAINLGRHEDEGWRLRKDGTKFWANVVITTIRSPSGEVLGFTKVTRDLTVKKAAEDALKQSEERFRLMVDGVKDYAIFMLDADGRVATWNDGARQLKGYSTKEILGKHFSNCNGTRAGAG